jgi:hypothetical protein
MQYRPREIIDYGFAGLNPTMELVESGEAARHPVMPNSDALVAYVRTIGLQAGDRQFLSVQGPGGVAFAAYDPPALGGDKAQFLISAGKKRTGAAWPSGSYTATYRVMREGTEVLRKTFDVEAFAR